MQKEEWSTYRKYLTRLTAVTITMGTAVQTPTLQLNSILGDISFSPSHEREHVDVVHSVWRIRIGPVSISGILPLFMKKTCVFSLRGEPAAR